MKKIYAILILIGLFVGSQVLADVVTTTRKINRPTTQQYHKPTTPSRTTGSRLSDSVKIAVLTVKQWLLIWEE